MKFSAQPTLLVVLGTLTFPFPSRLFPCLASFTAPPPYRPHDGTGHLARHFPRSREPRGTAAKPVRSKFFLDDVHGEKEKCASCDLSAAVPAPPPHTACVAGCCGFGTWGGIGGIRYVFFFLQFVREYCALLIRFALTIEYGSTGRSD